MIETWTSPATLIAKVKGDPFFDPASNGLCDVNPSLFLIY